MFIFLHRLKINHGSHEFILESGTVANTTHPPIPPSSPTAAGTAYMYTQTADGFLKSL
jgi:hypothetical protein